MKKDIHPKYFPQAKVICTCGNQFEVGSTKERIEVEICYKCHPFYTGQEKIVDTRGRVEKFKERLKKSEKLKAKISSQAQKEEKTSKQKEKILREGL